MYVILKGVPQSPVFQVLSYVQVDGWAMAVLLNTENGELDQHSIKQLQAVILKPDPQVKTPDMPKVESVTSEGAPLHLAKPAINIKNPDNKPPLTFTPRKP